MKRNTAISLFTAMIALSPAAIAQTPSNSPAPPMIPPPTPTDPTDKDHHSNKGGRLRGLDRADQAAGEHSAQGRDRARDAQLNRPDRSERSGLQDRPVRPDRPGR